MSITTGTSELQWPDDLGRHVTGLDRDFADRSILDDDFRAHLARRTDELDPEFAELAEQLRDRLHRPPFYVVLRGLRFHPDNVLLAVLASRVGRPVQPYPDPSYAVIRKLRPCNSSRTPEWGVLTEWLHTDSTNWWIPHDYTMMLCQQHDQRGAGSSLVLPLDDALAAIADALGQGAIDRLRSEPLPWAIAEEFGGGVSWTPALLDRGIRWQLFRVDEAVRRDAAKCTRSLLDFLSEVDHALHGSARLREFNLLQNDLLIVNNRYTLHGRRPIPNPAESERVLVHCKVNTTEPDDVGPGLASCLPQR